MVGLDGCINGGYVFVGCKVKILKGVVCCVVLLECGREYVFFHFVAVRGLNFEGGSRVRRKTLRVSQHAYRAMRGNKNIKKYSMESSPIFILGKIKKTFKFVKTGLSKRLGSGV